MSVTFSDLTEFKNLETNMATIMNVKVSDEKCFYILLITACPETGGDTQPGGGVGCGFGCPMQNIIACYFISHFHAK